MHLPIFRRLSCLFSVFLLAAPFARSAVGSPDPDFNPSFIADTGSGNPRVMAPLPDGKLLVCGPFSTVNGVARRYLARLHADGSLDPSFDAKMETFSQPLSVVVTPDHQILVGSWPTTIDGTPVGLLARLNPDGSRDPGFNSAIDVATNEYGPFVTKVARQPDGKILAAGAFVSVAGAGPKYLTRLNADGSRDTTFTPPVLGVRAPAFTLLQDGRILLWGTLTTVNGVTRSIVLLNADGSVDPNFNPTYPAHSVSQLQQLPNGQLLLAGTFGNVNGVSRPGMAILNLDGSLDPAYGNGGSPSAGSTSIFEAGGAVITSNLSRVLSDGSVDSGFNAHLVNPGAIHALAAFEDGRLLVAGNALAFRPPQFAQSIPRQLAAVYGPPATSVLTVPDNTRIQWLRGGSVPLTNQVFFEYSADGQTNWTLLGAGTWLGNGLWQLTGLNLPESGYVRGKAQATTSTTRGSGFVGATTFYNFVAPALRVEQPAGRQRAGGSTISFTSVLPGRGSTRDFTIRNFGSATLSGLSVSFSGPDAAMFALVWPPPMSLSGPGGSGSFTVRFSPTSAGTKTATLQVASNDPAQAGYQLTLTGDGLAAGSLDPYLTRTTLLTNPPVRGVSYSAALTPSGQIVVGGQFDAIGALARGNVGRVNLDGTADFNFNTTADSFVYALAVQNDGRLLVGGTFGRLNGAVHNGFGRFNTDGSVDSSFNPSVSGVAHMLVQPDGKIVVVAQNGTFARLHADGSPDGSFTPAVLPNANPLTLLQPDGKFVVASAVSVDSKWQTTIRRLGSTGSLDTGFNLPVMTAAVLTMAMQADGKIVIGGYIYPQGGGFQPFVSRLNADGTSDGTFDITGSGALVWSLAIQADGKILVGGLFSDLAGPASNIVRLNADGMRDNTFNVATDADVLIVTSQANGDVLAGGQFANPPGGVFRILQSGVIDSLSAPSADRVQWLRGGSAPEVTHVSFELSTDGGTTWSPLGAGTRVAGGWSLDGLSLPQTGQIRALGRTQNGGYFGSSSSLVQSQAAVSLSFIALESWRALHHLAADGSQDAANPSGDGIANLLKFAFNMAPNAGDLANVNVGVLPANGTAGLPFIDRDAQGRLVIEFIRRKAATNSGITYVVETGDDLTDLQPLALTGASVGSIDAAWERVTVIDPVITPKRFGRVRVTKLGP